MYEYLLQSIMLDELYPAVLCTMYQTKFSAAEGAYANGVSLLNAASDIDLFERLGVPRKFWLLSFEQEQVLRSTLGPPLVFA